MSIFSKKHYEFLSNTIRDHVRFPSPDLGTETDFVVKTFADAFEKENPNFNREKFLKACGFTHL